MRHAIALFIILSGVCLSSVFAAVCTCDTHIGTQYCYSEAPIDECSNCNSSTCAGQTKNCCTGPNLNGASGGSSCSSPATYDIRNVTYSIIPDGIGETCDSTQCCCLLGSFTVSRTPAGSLTMYLSGSLVGKCGTLQLPMTLNLIAGGQTYAIVSDFLGMGPTVIEGNTKVLTFQPVRNSKCFIASQASGAPGVGAIIGIVFGVLVGAAIIGVVIFWIIRRKRTAGYSQV